MEKIMLIGSYTFTSTQGIHSILIEHVGNSQI